MAKQSPVLAPKRLFLQILALQLSYYLIGAFLITFALFFMGVPWELHYIFSWEDVTSSTTIGWVLMILWLFCAVFSVIALMFIVGRSKLAVDFALTLYVINFLVCWIYSGRVPASWLWYILQLISALVTVYAGKWASQWRELRKAFFEDYEILDVQNNPV